METKPEKKDRRPRGRPVKNQVEPINATAPDIAKALFRAADKKIVKPKQS